MPRLSFNVSVFIDNAGFLPELQSRVEDLSPAFGAIYQEWVRLNEQKFEQSVGRELAGAQVFEEFWAGLSPAYMKQKHSGGSTQVTNKMAQGKSDASFSRAFPDWLMVRTGALRAAMTNPEALFSDIEPQSAVFGTPNDPELANIVKWQAGEKQHGRYVIFLSDPDVNAINRILQDYLGLGGNFQEIRSQRAMDAIRRNRETAKLDADFSATAGEG